MIYPNRGKHKCPQTALDKNQPIVLIYYRVSVKKVVGEYSFIDRQIFYKCTRGFDATMTSQLEAIFVSESATPIGSTQCVLRVILNIKKAAGA